QIPLPRRRLDHRLKRCMLWSEEGIMDRLFSKITRIAFCLALAFLPAMAQTTTGSIVGTVTDKTGAVVPGAALTVTNIDTGSSNKTITDSSGNYAVTPLPVGHYSVTVEAKGFKKSVSGGITLNLQDRIGVNVVLELGQISETVEVVGAA